MLRRWLLNPRMGIFLPLAALLIFLVACGDDVEVTVVVPGDNVEVTRIVTPTATAEDKAAASKQTVTIVFGDEPLFLGVWGEPGCRIIPSHFPCMDGVSDPLTYIDSTTFETIPMSGVESWEQVAPDRWQFSLKEGVKFHNGEEWNAAAAKMGIDMISNPSFGSASISYTGNLLPAVVVDDMTVEIVCETACPILAKTAFLIWFQAPEWYAGASVAERASQTIGFGPYKMIGEGLGWRRGLDVTMGVNEDYIPNPDSPNDTRAATIDEIKMIWRGEPFVRAAMVQVGEADWAFDIGLDLKDDVPVFDHGGAAETFVNVFDTLWTPEMKKLKVRQALAHATDCDLLVDTFYDGFYECHGHGAPPGTLGLTPRNSAQYEFNPDLARQLLEEANYDPSNEIIINVFSGRFFNNVELAEAQAGMWRDVGVNAKIQVLETANWLERSRTGCGRASVYYFTDEGLDIPDDFCLSEPPGPPLFGFPQSYQLNPSLEALDLSRFVGSRMDCRGSGAKFCDPVNVQPLIDPCLAATGAARATCMTELADIAYDQVLMYTYFNAEVFYGVSEDLVWTPRFDRRPRINQWDIN